MYLVYFLNYLGLLVPVRLHRHLQNIRRFSVSKNPAGHGGTHLSFAGSTAQRAPLVPGGMVLVDPDLLEGMGVWRRGLPSPDSDPLPNQSNPLNRISLNTL